MTSADVRAMPPAADILDLGGRVAVVTGAGQGIGRQVALHFAAHGAAGIVVNDFYADRAERVADEVRTHGAAALPYRADVGDFDAVATMIAAARRELGGVDILVNNAGNMGPQVAGPEALKPFVHTAREDWDRWLGVNLYGAMNCTRHVLPGMIEAQRGSIVSVISEAGRLGDTNMEAYAAAKAGVAGLMRSVARGMARHGIRANSVAIAATRTPAIAAVLEDETFAAKQRSRYPLRRVGEPADVANAVLFLASDAAGFVTGQVYAVNGGLLFSQ